MAAASALLRAIRQAGDPAFLRVLVLSAVLSLVCFGLLTAGIAWGLHRLLAGHGAFADAAAVLGGAGSLLLALWLFLPVAAAIASLFLEPICAAVERRFYPGLPAPVGAPLMVQIGDGVGLGLRILGLTVLSLVLALLVPGIGIVLGWLVNGWAIGRGLFVAVAMRRMSRGEALALYRASRLSVLPEGGVLAVAGSAPLINLLVPVLGTAAMVHLVERARSGARRESGVLR